MGAAEWLAGSGCTGNAGFSGRGKRVRGVGWGGFRSDMKQQAGAGEEPARCCVRCWGSLLVANEDESARGLFFCSLAGRKTKNKNSVAS